MGNRLKSCPFCGGGAKYYLGDNGGEFIACTHCGASTSITFSIGEEVKQFVIGKWNTRIKERGSDVLSNQLRLRRH